MALLADPNGIPPGARLSGRLGRDGLIETRIFKRMVFPADDIVRIEARPGGERRCGGDASAKPAPGPESGVAARARQLLNQPLGGYSAYLFILSDGRHVPIHSYTCSGSEPLFRLSATLTGPDMTTIEARYVGGSETFDIGAIVAIHEDGL